MAFNPLQQRMADAGQVSEARGMSTSEAAASIEALLDDEGRSPGHVDRSDGNTVRGENQASDEGRKRAPDQNPDVDEDLEDNEDDDTAQAEGDDVEDTADTGDDDQAADGDEEDGDPITNLNALAEAAGMPLEEFLKLEHTFKAAGQERTATLADIIAGYQLRADYDRDKTSFAEQRRVFEAEQQARVQLFEKQAHVQASQFNMVEQALIARMQDPKLAELRQYNQAEYLIQVRDIEQQVNNLRAARQQASQAYDQFIDQERQAFMRAEGVKLRDSIPDWGDDKLRAAVDTIKTLGYDDQEVVNVVDSRLIKGALELAQLRTENAALKQRIQNAEKAAGTVKRTIPKTITPGKTTATRSGRGPDRNAISKLNRRLSQTNSVKDAAKVIESLMS